MNNAIQATITTSLITNSESARTPAGNMIILPKRAANVEYATQLNHWKIFDLTLTFSEVKAPINLDMKVANDVAMKDIGFNSDFNKVSMMDQKGNIKILPKNKKSFIANKIAQILLDKLIDDRNIN